MALLAAEALDFGHGDALHANGRQGLTHFIKLEGLDDGGHHFHGWFSCEVGKKRRQAKRLQDLCQSILAGSPQATACVRAPKRSQAGLTCAKCVRND
jgi:hypothetical protein